MSHAQSLECRPGSNYQTQGAIQKGEKGEKGGEKKQSKQGCERRKNQSSGPNRSKLQDMPANLRDVDELLHCSHLWVHLPDLAAPGFLSTKLIGQMKAST
ncbi:hypothetical protein H1C71_042044 [Ictidomys tridecemlineatus]|nr:hypothetical protein H1C71_042044 [Ictidomys tridecemlineatus]